MCRKWFLLTFLIVLTTMTGSAVQAELQLVENFESLVGESPDDQACSGVLGGTWDTQSDGTGNIDLVYEDGSRNVSVLGNSGGQGRAIGFNGITNTIDNGETGILFFRFKVRSTSRVTRTFIGLISDTSDNPVASGNTNDPLSIPAGFSLVHVDSDRFDVTTIDKATVLKADLARDVLWYNMWMVANNAADTFDLYLSEAEGPAGEATLPNPEDLVADNIPFTIATADPLTGMIISNPSGTSQADKVWFDEVYWDGDQGLKTPTQARNPIPVIEATDVPREVTLSWEPAPFDATHDVYFGDVFDDVVQATATNDPAGVYKGRVIPNSYTLPERLKFGLTYYWRIDEVNATPDNTVHRGSIWSFETELLAYPIENVTATASSSAPGKDAENTVNGSGLDEAGLLHDNANTDTMWLSESGAEQPTWIEFEFDAVHKLYEMWVWNSNESLEQQVGMGFRDVTIQYSTDGIEYATLGTTHEFTQGPSTANYEHNTTINMEGVAAKYVKLTANSNWKELFEQYGLSEVRFFSIPVMARKPSPDLDAADVELDLMLGWRAGREADTHEVYFDEDLQAVTDGTAPMTPVTETSYGPLSLDIGKTYYWRVDEVNDAEIPAIWPGNIWSFTTLDSLLVEDFESYNAEDNQIWYAWTDGLGYGTQDIPPYYAGNGTGAAVGDENTDSFTEETIVHGGKQSMPLFYNNNKQGYLNYSETTMTLISQRDWTVRGVKELSLWFRGLPGSVGSFAEGPDGTYTMTASGEDIYNEADEFHYAFRQLTGAGSIIARVDSVEQTNDWAKAGVMIRETLEPGSKHALACVTPVNGVAFQGRTAADSGSFNSNESGITAPHWIKLERDVMGSFMASHSADGSNWVPVGSSVATNVPMNSSVYIGLALTSHDAVLTCEAKFSNVKTTGMVTGQWQSQDIGISSNSAEIMYVAVGNSTGNPAIVYHDDPAATQIDTWTDWIIDLNQLADLGVNLADVDNISIGIGDRNNPQPGGSGTVYIDDIRLYPDSILPATEP